MAVVEKPREQSLALSGSLQQKQMAMFAGAIFIVGALAIVFSGLPQIWAATVGLFLNPFLSTTLVVGLSAVAGVGFLFVGRELERRFYFPGLRAGAVITAAVLLFAAIVTLWLANLLEFRGLGAIATWGLAGLAGLSIVVAAAFALTKPAVLNWLVESESQGWFHARAFKPNQGLRVRRATLIGLLVIIGFGIFTASRGRMFQGLFGGENWGFNLPYFEGFTEYTYVYFLHNVAYTGPLLFFAVLAWFSWRVVNYPRFADFLIATEAEMNKVSWTTRRRLIQDTIVVLVTVVLLTVFLFAVDYFWIKVLSVPGVLQIDPKQEIARQREATDW